MKRISQVSLAALTVGMLSAGTIQLASAAVSASEAGALGTTLTKFGGEKAGNADGSIPAYDGGLKVPGSTDGMSLVDAPNPYAGEKPLYTVTSSNLAQYKDQITAGNLAIFERFPDYRLDVYPTHRSVWYPEWIADNSVKNATSCEMTGATTGDALKGSHADGLCERGIPFPMPKDGYEVMWNHKVYFGPTVIHQTSLAWIVGTGGEISALPGVDEYFVRSWWDQTATVGKDVFDSTFGFMARLTSPPSSAGIVFLNWYLASAEGGGQQVWFYTPGQRRVRKAPEFAYDVPIASYGGVIMWDEIFGFVGRLDRFDFTLTGKKDMLVPYNVFGAAVYASPADNQANGKSFINPEQMRWEKHRIWVVDAERKSGARHAYKHRTFYIDEDSWTIVSADGYDDSGKLWRAHNIHSFPSYNTGGLSPMSWSTNDLIKGNYFVINTIGGKGKGILTTHTTAAGMNIPLTANAVAAASVR